MEKDLEKRVIPMCDPVFQGGGNISRLYKDRVFRSEGFPELIGLMREEDRVVLDVGCGAGTNAKLMTQVRKTVHPVHVHAITLSEAEAELVASDVDEIAVGNIETMPLNYPDGFFDAMLMSHVLEHLVDPWGTLNRLRKYLRPGGRIYVALPNVMFYQERLKLLMGDFRYASAGIIDRLHLRFFTYRTAQELVEEGGYRVVLAKAIGSFPLWPLRLLFRGKHTWVDRTACDLFPNLFGWHVIVVGEKVPQRGMPMKD